MVNFLFFNLDCALGHVESFVCLRERERLSLSLSSLEDHLSPPTINILYYIVVFKEEVL